MANVTVDPTTIPDTPEKLIIVLGIVFAVFLGFSIGWYIYLRMTK